MLKYHLEIKSSLHIKLEEEGSRRILYLDTLKRFDSPPLQLLIKLHLRANGGKSLDTLSFQQIEIPLAHSIEAIRLIGSTGQLYSERKKLEVKAQKSKVHWSGDKKTGIFQAFLDGRPLDQVEIFLGGWAISNGVWSEIDATVPWKWIEMFRRGPVQLTAIQQRNFLEEEPQILWEENESLPHLELVDGTGSFANLLTIEWESDLLEAGYTRKEVAGSRYFCPGEKVGETLRFLLELGWTVSDKQGRKLLLQSGCDLQLREESCSIALQGAVRFGTIAAPLQKAVKGRLFLELDKGHVGLLDLKAIPRIQGEWIDDEMHISHTRIGEIIPLLETAEWEGNLRKRAEVLRSGLGPKTTPLDSRFSGTLLPYQQEGVDWLLYLRSAGFGALLSDEMGLGKTVQVLAVFSQLRTNLPILIVAPTSLLFNWEREIARFWPGAKVYLHSGPDRKSPFGQCQVILTSYAILRQDIALFQPIEFEAIALDEAQAIKTASSQAAIAACSLRGRFRIAVTGTPVENRADELWSQFRFIAPDLLGSKADFQATQLEVVRRKIKPFILRRKKSDVQLQLPDKIEQTLWIEMEAGQQALYDRTLSEFKSGLLKKVQADGLQAHRMEVLEAILRLRQICCDPRLIGEGEKGAKIEQLLLDVEELLAEGKKVLIFSQFTTALRLIRQELNDPLYLDGSTPAEERGPLVERFQNETKPCVFLLSLKAGGVGLNLTSAEAVILFDPWWNEAVERQAIDRAHRIGQKSTLFVRRYLTPQTIEEKMVAVKERKADIADQLLSEDDPSLRAEDLLHLLT